MFVIYPTFGVLLWFSERKETQVHIVEREKRALRRQLTLVSRLAQWFPLTQLIEGIQYLLNANPSVLCANFKHFEEQSELK